MIQDEHVIKCRISIAKAAFGKKMTFFTRKLNLNLRKKLVKCYILKIDKKYLETSEMWCWRRMENRVTLLKMKKYGTEPKRKGISYVQ